MKQGKTAGTCNTRSGFHQFFFDSLQNTLLFNKYFNVVRILPLEQQIVQAGILASCVRDFALVARTFHGWSTPSDVCFNRYNPCISERASACHRIIEVDHSIACAAVIDIVPSGHGWITRNFYINSSPRSVPVIPVIRVYVSCGYRAFDTSGTDGTVYQSSTRSTSAWIGCTIIVCSSEISEICQSRSGCRSGRCCRSRCGRCESSQIVRFYGRFHI